MEGTYSTRKGGHPVLRKHANLGAFKSNTFQTKPRRFLEKVKISLRGGITGKEEARAAAMASVITKAGLVALRNPRSRQGPRTRANAAFKDEGGSTVTTLATGQMAGAPLEWAGAGGRGQAGETAAAGWG